MTINEPNFLKEYSRFLDPSGMHLTFSAVSTYLNETDGEDHLSNKERTFLKGHLDGCPSCAAMAEEIREVEGVTVRRRNSMILSYIPMAVRYPAAAVLMIGLGISMYHLLDDRIPEQEMRGPKSIDRPAAEVVHDASRFASNDILENFIGRTYRSSETIRGFHPTPGDTVENPVKLGWKNSRTPQNTIITVVDNADNLRWRRNTAADEATIDSMLTPGLYYVKLEQNDRLRFVGKFIITR